MLDTPRLVFFIDQFDFALLVGELHLQRADLLVVRAFNLIELSPHVDDQSQELIPI